MTKKCTACGLEKSLDDFHHWNQRDGRQVWCKACRKAYDREYHQSNRIRRQEQVRARRKRLQAWNNALKASAPCADCGGFFHPMAMTWDHLPGNEKVDEVSNLVKAGKTLQARNEIEKCELVCANCHAVRSYDRRIGA